MADRTHRLPIFKDDLTYQDRHTKAFQDMKDRMMGNTGLDSNWSRWNFDDDLDRMCGDFFQLKPSAGLSRRDDLKRGERDFGSRDSLEDHNVYVENPQTKSRTFHTSFDVKEYSPSEISVKAEGDSLVVQARHVEQVGEHQNVKEFSRSIKIPADVDVDKLTSTLSNDGILTIQAPVPPKYTSVAYVNPLSGGQSQNGSPCSSGPPYRARAPPSVHSQHSVQSPQPQSPIYPQYTQPPPPPAHSHEYTHQQTQNARPSPPPPPPPSGASSPQQPTPPPGPMNTQGAWPPPPPPPQYEPSPLVYQSPPPLFEQAPLPPMPLDTPTFKNGQNGGPREMELAIEVPKPFTPDDVVVKLEGKSLKVEATREEKAHGKSSKSSMSRSFDLEEDLDPGSVEAMLRSDGCLLIKGWAAQKS